MRESLMISWDNNGSHARLFRILCMITAAAFLFSALAPSAFAAYSGTIRGAGATFPRPVYEKWGARYHQVKGLNLAYQGIGSGGGIKKITGKAVDFGASDKPLNTVELVKTGLLQFPMIMGGVVPVINVPGVQKGQLRLTTQLLSDIFLGKITNWSDDRIKAINPQLRLPNQKITVVHRSDGSGTTWIFTSYLSKVSGEWKRTVGAGKKVEWPTGQGAKGNPGVASGVKRTRGAVGYVEFAYATEHRLDYVLLQNLAGNFVEPTIQSFQAAAENAGWDSKTGFIVDLNDQPGKDSWPINGVSYILVYKHQDDRDKTRAMLEFFDWCYTQGSQIAESLHYVPIPPSVYQKVQNIWRSDVTVGGQPVF